jgi:hypothetical protein
MVAQPQVGQQLYDLATNKPFIILCNCGGSSPYDHTQRFVAQHPERFVDATEFLARTSDVRTV